jgi:hypothetical protein
MVANPETNRLNGRKSRGPVTVRGKVIAAKNATKHGILAKAPPILVTEDLETFQGIVQELIDEYQPQRATEHLLIQQVAMGWLRLHRLWRVEAASANIEVLKVQLNAKFPDLVTPPSRIIPDEYSEKRVPKREALLSERKTLKELVRHFEQDKAELPEKDDPYDFEWLQGVQESSGVAHYYTDRSAQVWQEQDKFDLWIDPWVCLGEEDERSAGEPPPVTDVVARFEKLQKLAHQRIQEINEILAELESYTKAIEQAQTASQGIQNPELFARYEKAITSSLYDALDRLQAIQQQRQ